MPKSFELLDLEPISFDDHPHFRPDFSPKTMLRAGVFGGCYFRNNPDNIAEFPADWFEEAVMMPSPNHRVNYFEVDSGQPYEVWRDNGWITEEDPLGWFQWYCRFYAGRRLNNGVDGWQIGRWSSFKARHSGGILKGSTGPASRPRQRQGLLHWASDPQPDQR